MKSSDRSSQRRPAEWLGLLVTLGTVAVLVVLAATPLRVEYPGGFLFLAIVGSTFVGGLRIGLLCAVVAWLFSAYNVLESVVPLEFSRDAFARLWPLAVSYPLIALFTGVLYERLRRRTNELEALTRELEGRVAARTAELRERNAALTRSNEELEQFAYVASHDLQEPLRTVTSFADLVERHYGAALDERGRAYLGHVTAGAGRMRRLIQDLLLYSRVTASQERGPVEVRAVWTEVIAGLSRSIEAAGASVLADGLPEIEGNAVQLGQLLQNLVSNALKFRREDVPPVIHLHAAREGDHWHLCLRDNGIGMEAQYFDKVTVIFQRLHPRERYEGSGIGLAIARRIVEQHGGRLWFESRPGEGTTVHFTLAAAPPPAAPPES